MALPIRRKPPSWRGVKAASVLLCFVAIAGYVAAYYFVPRSVEGYRVTLVPASLEIAGPALLDARNKVTVSARIQGYLKAINVDRNDQVNIGDILAELDSADLASQLAAAEADAKAAVSAIAEARSDQQRARALAEKASQDYTRKQALRDKQIITEADWSATEAAYHQTQADLARSVTTIAKASALSASAEANAHLLGVRLSYATIKSPLNGVVVSRDRNAGDLLSPGTSLLQIVDPNSIIVSARLDESAMGSLSAGQNAVVRFASLPTEDFAATVLRVIRLVDQETREFTVDLVMDRLPPHWALGQRANVVIKAPSHAPTITVPQDLVATQDGRVGVWRLRNGRAEWTAVELGYPSGNRIQVLNGLEVNDVILKPANLYAYMPVALKDAQP